MHRYIVSTFGDGNLVLDRNIQAWRPPAGAMALVLVTRLGLIDALGGPAWLMWPGSSGEGRRVSLPATPVQRAA